MVVMCVVWPFKSEEMDTNIIELGEYKYVEEGTGEPLIVLHGLFGAMSNFSHVREHFKCHYS